MAGPVSQAFVANPDKCSQCHRKQYDFWMQTRHASAYLVLFSKNQHFDPDCAKCHTLGLGKPGGFNRIAEPIEVIRGAPCIEGRAWVECFLDGVFETGGLSLKPLDARKDASRYASLKQRYHERRAALAGQVKKDFMNVQCEHCHGDRGAHIAQNFKRGSRVSEKTCRACHVPERDPTFTFAKIREVGCPQR